MKRIPNPWHKPGNPYSPTEFEVSDNPNFVKDGMEFYRYDRFGASVLAVKGGRVVTQCVTVAGALVHLANRSAPSPSAPSERGQP